MVNVPRGGIWIRLPAEEFLWQYPGPQRTIYLTPTITAVPFQPEQWRYGLDEPVSNWWIGGRNNVLYDTPVSLPLYSSSHWQFMPEDATIWQPTSRRNIALLSVRPIQPTQLQPVEDQNFWWPQPQRNNVLLSVLPKPVPTVTWTYGLDDTVGVVYGQRNNALLGTGVVVTAQPFLPSAWRYAVDDTVPLAAAQRNNALLNTPPVPPPIFPSVWRYGLDDSINTISFVRNNALLDTPAVQAALPFRPTAWTAVEDQSYWQPVSGRNVALLTPAVTPAPFIPKGWQFGVEDAVGWTPSPRRNVALLSTVPARPRSWAYGLDEPQGWIAFATRNNTLYDTAVHRRRRPIYKANIG